MKRDMDTIRAIVLAVRDAKDTVNTVEGVDDQQFAFHVQLLKEAGLVRANTADKVGNRIAKQAYIYRLTWDGHDFADSIIDDTIWNKAKQHLLGPSAAWSFAILKEVVTATIKEPLNLG